MKTVEFEGKELIVNPGGLCGDCYFKEDERPCFDIFETIEFSCIIKDCNFILKTDGKPEQTD